MGLEHKLNINSNRTTKLVKVTIGRLLGKEKDLVTFDC